MFIAQGKIVRIDGDARGLKVECSAGRVWVTQRGYSRDEFAGSGAPVTVATKGRVLIVALADAEVHVTQSERHASTKRTVRGRPLTRRRPRLRLRLRLRAQHGGM